VKIRHAPRYQSRLTLAERVQVLDSSGWPLANADEIASMGDDDGDVAIIGIPRHLLKRWWSLVESDHVTTGFEGYAREIAEYFMYKNWILPANAVMEVAGSDGHGDGALVPSHPTRFSTGVGKLLACINLGDENAAIAFGAASAQIRVVLEPGEGVMLPVGGAILWGRSTLGSSDVAVTLLIGELTSQSSVVTASTGRFGAR
jgi:hypothetical protein